MLTLRVDILKGKRIQGTSCFEAYRHICASDKGNMLNDFQGNRCQHDSHTVM